MAGSDLELMDSKQAADYLGLTPGRIRQLARAGHLAGVRVGRDWIFTLDTLKAFKASPRPGVGRPKGSKI